MIETATCAGSAAVAWVHWPDKISLHGPLVKIVSTHGLGAGAPTHLFAKMQLASRRFFAGRHAPKKVLDSDCSTGVDSTHSACADAVSIDVDTESGRNSLNVVFRNPIPTGRSCLC